MTFAVKDLMIDVCSAGDPRRMACDGQTIPPKPQCPAHSCEHNSAKKFEDDGVELAPLAVLREQLQRTLHA